MGVIGNDVNDNITIGMARSDDRYTAAGHFCFPVPSADGRHAARSALVDNSAKIQRGEQRRTSKDRGEGGWRRRLASCATVRPTRQAEVLRRRAAGEPVSDAEPDWPTIAEEIEAVGMTPSLRIASSVGTAPRSQGRGLAVVARYAALSVPCAFSSARTLKNGASKSPDEQIAWASTWARR